MHLWFCVKFKKEVEFCSKRFQNRSERILKVDRNILRLASYELFFSPNLSIGIIINEAIEIARKFSSEKSASFVNGILDAISKDARKNISNKKYKAIS